MVGCLECLEDLWIHLYSHVLILNVLLGPDLNLAIHPLFEPVANDGVNDVGYIATR